MLKFSLFLLIGISLGIIIWNQAKTLSITYVGANLFVASIDRQTPCLQCVDDYMTSNKITLLDEISFSGYGNRIYAFLNVLSFAIITNRSVICQWNRIKDYIQPVPLKRVALNKPFEFFAGNLTANLTDFAFDSVNVWKVNKPFDKMLKRLNSSLDSYVVVNITTFNAWFFEFVCLPETMDRFSATGLIKEKYVQEAKRLFTNKSTYLSEERKTEIAYKLGFDLVHTFLTKLWLPSDLIAAKMSTILSKHFDSRTFIIGIQVRKYYLNLPNDLEQILNCALEIEKQQNSSMKIKWYVTADEQELIDQIKSEYGEKVITASGQIAHIEKNEGYERAIIDNEMLSKCDELIITGGSTFGMTAAMRMGRMPLFFVGKKNCTQCSRMTFANPGPNHKNIAMFR